MDGFRHTLFLQEERPGCWRTWRAAPAIRNSSSTLTDANSGSARKPSRDFGRGQRLEPELPAAFRRHPLLRKRPRCGLEDIPVAPVAIREDVLDVVGEVPPPALADRINRDGRHHLVIVIDQVEERLLNVARP